MKLLGFMISFRIRFDSYPIEINELNFYLKNGQSSSPILDSVRDLKTLTAFIRPAAESAKNVEADHYEVW